MDQKYYLNILKTNLIFFVVLVAVGAIVGYLTATNYPKSQGFEKIFYVSKPDQIEISANENVNNFTDSAVYILQTAEFQKSHGFENTPFAVRKMAPHVIKVTTSGSDPDSIATLVTSFNTDLLELENSNPTYQLKPVSSRSEEVTKGLSTKTTTTAGAIFGLAAALAIVGLKTYLKL